jgi:hypothetical protein
MPEVRRYYPGVANLSCLCRTPATSVFHVFDYGWVVAWLFDFPWRVAVIVIASGFVVTSIVLTRLAMGLGCWEGLKRLVGWVVPRRSSDGGPFSFPSNFYVNATIEQSKLSDHAHGHPYLAERRAVLRANAALALSRCEGWSTTGKCQNLNVFGGPRNFKDVTLSGSWEHYQVKSAYNTRDLYGATKFDDYDQLINTVYSRGGVDRVFMWDAAWFLSAEQMAKVLARREFVLFNMRRTDMDTVYNPFSGRVESTIKVDGHYVTERVMGGDLYHHACVHMPNRDKFSAAFTLYGVRRVFQFQRVKVNVFLKDRDGEVKPDLTVYEDIWAAAEVNHAVADFNLSDMFPQHIKCSGIQVAIDDSGVLTHAVRRRVTSQGHVVNRLPDKLFKSVQQAVASSTWGLYFENSIRMRAPGIIDNEDYSVEEIVELALQLRTYNEVGRSGRVEGLLPVAKAWLWRQVSLMWYRMVYRREPAVLTFRARTNWANGSMGTGRVSQAAGDSADVTNCKSTGDDTADGGGPRRSASSGCDPQPPPPTKTGTRSVSFTDDQRLQAVRKVPPPARQNDRRSGDAGSVQRHKTPPPPARGRGRPTQSVTRDSICRVSHQSSMARPQAARSSQAARAGSAGDAVDSGSSVPEIISLGPGAATVSAGLGSA